MRTVYIMVEGQTEEEFVNNTIAHYLRKFGINNCVPILLETSPGFFGGDITFTRYKHNAELLLISDPNSIVTSLIDYYELRNDFPRTIILQMLFSDAVQRVQYLDQEILNIIINNRLVPYIQLHEFERLLFSNIRGFNYIPHADIGKAQYIINHYPNPELINDSPITAPSIRLKEIIPRYKRNFMGL